MVRLIKENDNCDGGVATFKAAIEAAISADPGKGSRADSTFR